MGSNEDDELDVEDYMKSIEDAVDDQYEELLNDLKSNLGSWRQEIGGFEDRLQETWGDSLDLLEAFIVYTRETGNKFGKKYGQEADKENDIKFAALKQLHARSCQVAMEIFTLLKHGYADGAHARWRALHEIASVSRFIKQYDDEIAGRFLLYRAIDDYHEMKELRNHEESLPENEVISDKKFKELEKQKDRLIEQLGEDFGKPYGWAAPALERDRFGFKEIEQKAGLEHHRPYYKFASDNVHAGSKGTLHSLSRMQHANRANAPLMTGPSNYGLALPGRHTTVSLHQTTTAILTTRPDEEFLWDLQILSRLMDDIEQSLYKTQSKIEERQRKKWEESLKDELEDNIDNILASDSPDRSNIVIEPDKKEREDDSS